LRLAAGTEPREFIVSITCDVILQWNATAEQLTALGAALWRWCRDTSGDAGTYQYLDNQALADLIAGKFPVPSQTSRQTDRRGVYLRLRDEASRDRQATVASLRQGIPAGGVEDILVDGKSWDRIG
jgi:hypothetical protein